MVSTVSSTKTPTTPHIRGAGVLLTAGLALKPTVSVEPLLDPSVLKVFAVASLIVTLRSLYNPEFCSAPLILSVVNEIATASTVRRVVCQDWANVPTWLTHASRSSHTLVLWHVSMPRRKNCYVLQRRWRTTDIVAWSRWNTACLPVSFVVAILLDSPVECEHTTSVRMARFFNFALKLRAAILLGSSPKCFYNTSARIGRFTSEDEESHQFCLARLSSQIATTSQANKLCFNVTMRAIWRC